MNVYYLDPLDRGNFHTKAKIDQICQIQEKKNELLNGYFHSRTLFLTPERFRTVLNGFERFFNAFWTLFERLLNAFFHSRTSEVSGTAKTTLVFFFPHQPPKSIFFGFGVKKCSIWKLQVYKVNALHKLLKTDGYSTCTSLYAHVSHGMEPRLACLRFFRIWRDS